MCDPANGDPLDVIVVAANAPASERDHTLLHELAHLLLGHHAQVPPQDVLRFVAGDATTPPVYVTPRVRTQRQRINAHGRGGW